MAMVGIMEVKLIGAKGLKRSDFFGKIDPYVVIQYRNEEHRSSTARGRKPVWNEEFKFRVDADDYQNNYKLSLSIFDRDTFTKDDYLGNSMICLKELFEVGLDKGKADLGTQRCRVVQNDHTYHGEIDVAITFTAKVRVTTNQPRYLMEKKKEILVSCESTS